MSVSDSDEYSDLIMTQTSEMEYEEMENANMRKEDSIFQPRLINEISSNPIIQKGHMLTTHMEEIMQDTELFFKDNNDAECAYFGFPYPENFRLVFEEFRQMVEEKCVRTTTQMEFEICAQHLTQFKLDFTFFKENYDMYKRLSMFSNFRQLDKFNQRDLQNEKNCYQRQYLNGVKECKFCKEQFILPDQINTIIKNDELPCKCKHFIMHTSCQRLYYTGDNTTTKFFNTQSNFHRFNAQKNDAIRQNKAFQMSPLQNAYCIYILV